MSQENVEIVRRAIDALNERNVDAYLSRASRRTFGCKPRSSPSRASTKAETRPDATSKT
jgi:hypothetical protein